MHACLSYILHNGNNVGWKKCVNTVVKCMYCTYTLTNRPVEGWDSIYRSMVTALINTSPRQVSKSSTEDSALPRLAVYCVISWQQADITSSLADAISPQRGCVEWTHIQQPELTRKLAELQYAWTLDRPPDVWSTYSIVTVTRTDSSLEAFSYNPTDGSFVPLFGRTSTCTNCPRQRFLSYWAAFLS